MLRILLLSLFLGNVSFAAETKQKKKEDVYANKGNIDVGTSKTSSVNRRDKKIAINVGAGYESVTATFSVGLAYIIDENLMIDFRASEGENESTTDAQSFSSLSLGAKFFTSDSFYIRPAFEYISVSELENGLLEEIKGKGFSFTVGNQWQYRNFTIGVDWLGIKHIINANEILNDANRTHFSVAGFYVGTTF